jgi:hypothetical protein
MFKYFVKGKSNRGGGASLISLRDFSDFLYKEGGGGWGGGLST